MTKMHEQLKLYKQIFVLSLYGDTVTIKKIPLINIFASGVHNPAALLEIVDFHDELVECGKKDADYISMLFEEHIKRLDPHKNVLDCLFLMGDPILSRQKRL